jgi:hypothetical protein
MPLDADVSAVHPRSADRGKLFCRGCSCFAPPVRARSAARASPRLLGIASAACFGAPLARDHLALPVYPTQLHAPRSQVMGAGVRAYSGHLLPPAGGTHSASQTPSASQAVPRERHHSIRPCKRSHDSIGEIRASLTRFCSVLVH